MAVMALGRPWRRVCAAVYREESVCWLCGIEVDKTRPYRDRNGRVDMAAKSVDHVVPRSKGGPDTRQNARLAHRGCNVARGARAPKRRKASRRW